MKEMRVTYNDQLEAALTAEIKRNGGKVVVPELQTFSNLYPNTKCTAVINRSHLGFFSFKSAKKTNPIQKLLYKKYTRMDPVQANKKFFRQHPGLVEFAKQQPIPKEVEYQIASNR